MISRPMVDPMVGAADFIIARTTGSLRRACPGPPSKPAIAPDRILEFADQRIVRVNELFVNGSTRHSSFAKPGIGIRGRLHPAA